MKLLLALLSSMFLISCTSSVPDRIVTLEAGAVLTLTATKCTNITILNIAKTIGLPQKYTDQLKAGKRNYKATSGNICYAMSSPKADSVFIIDEDFGPVGEQFFVSKNV